MRIYTLILAILLLTTTAYASLQGMTLQGATMYGGGVAADSFFVLQDGTSYFVLQDGTSKFQLN